VTINVYDTILSYETISVYDTTMVNDTILSYDTTMVNDTILSYETISVYDTTRVNDTLYIDSIYNKTDTVVTLVPIDSFYNVGIEVPINDSFIVVEFEQYKIEYKDDGKLTDSPTFIVTGKVNNVTKGDVITVNINAMVYDQLGQFVNQLNDEVKLKVDSYDSTYEFVETFVVIEKRLGHLLSFYGRKLGNGVYIVNGHVRVLVNDEIRLSEERFNKFGHMR